jgi:uncharacterized protein DUF2800
MLSASSIPRLIACPASAVLPHRAYNTVHAAAGQERHLDREVAADLRDLKRLPASVASMIRSSDELLTEHAFVLNVATEEVHQLGRVGHRGYGALGPFEVGGTVDLLIVGTDRLIVVDYKGFEEVAPAEENAQLATYALMVSRAFGVDEVTVVIVYEIRRPSIAELGPLDLDAHAARLRQVYVDVAAARMNPGRYLKTGSHCKYCEAFNDCPRQKALAVDVETGLIEMRLEETIPFADDDEATWALDLCAELGRLQARIKAALEVRAKARPIPLRNGKAWGPIDKRGNEKLDGETTYAVMLERHGQALANLAAPRAASKKAVREALRFAGADSTLEEAFDAVYDEVKARGGIKTGSKTVIEEYEPGPKLVSDASEGVIR